MRSVDDAVIGRRGGELAGLAAAASFGISAPLAAALLDVADPQLLAGLLYLGAALALGVGWRVRRARTRPLDRADLPAVAVVALTGGIVAPVLLLLGLDRVGGLGGALLLNLETPTTLLVAIAVFGEHLDRRSMLGSAAVIAGAGLLGGAPGEGGTGWAGVGLIAGAAVLWAVDNNVSRDVATRSPLALVTTKCALAAAVNLAVAVLRGVAWPAPGYLAGALALGAVSYGASVLLDAHALRLIGAAREAALFATAPFAGAALAVAIAGRLPAPVELAAIAAMGLGVAALLTAHHEHDHNHPAEAHDHLHRHDDGHHEHAQEDGDGADRIRTGAHSGTGARGRPGPAYAPGGAHRHPHRHGARSHRHAHVSDPHHHHDHA
jgi:drug/metabolite transporter (DMT)-like permease